MAEARRDGRCLHQSDGSDDRPRRLPARAAPVAERRVLLARSFKPTSARGVERKERNGQADARRGSRRTGRSRRPRMAPHDVAHDRQARSAVDSSNAGHSHAGPDGARPGTRSSLSEAEEENGRIYLGIHWAFDKSERSATLSRPGHEAEHVRPDAPAAPRPCVGREPRSAPVAAGASEQPAVSLVGASQPLAPTLPDGRPSPAACSGGGAGPAHARCASFFGANLTFPSSFRHRAVALLLAQKH